jgi:hypothetical protein
MDAVDVEDLAIAANMGQAAFTANSIHHGHNLASLLKGSSDSMRHTASVFSDATAADPAREVGRASISQFSRDYSRMLRHSPRDVQKLEHRPNYGGTGIAFGLRPKL